MTRIRSNHVPWPTLLVVVVFLATAACKTQDITSAWADTPIDVDGKIDDWIDVPGIFFADQNAAVVVCNDEKSLYVLFKTTDYRWVRTIKMTGLTLYLNSENKKKKDFFIRLKGGPTQDQLNAMGDNRTSSSPSRRSYPTRDFEAHAEPSLTCYIKDRIVEKPIPLDGSEGPSAAFDTSQGFFAYEFSIPLTEGSVRYYGIGAAPDRQIAIGAEWGAMAKGMRPSKGGMGRRGGGGKQPGGAGRPGGMGGRGGMNSPSGARPEMPQKQEVWLETGLAIPPTTGLEQK